MSPTPGENNTDGLPVARADEPRPDGHTWVWQVTALSIALGILLALALRTTSRIRNSTGSSPRFGVSTAFLAQYKNQNNLLHHEIVDLRRQVDAYMESAKSDSQTNDSLKKQLDALWAVGGLSAVSGPGLRITVRYSTNVPDTQVADYNEFMVHDQDLNHVIAELKLAGAEHMAIAGADPTNLQRVIVRTTARCVGPVAFVNGTPLSAPYHILVLGEPKRLRERLERPDGYVRARQLDTRQMIVIEEVPELRLPEYSGALTPRYAKPVAEQS
jgi:uncharacterized protein YlxW (UPF0749 family)